jgi:Protein of unknown function (DUF3551)
MRMACAALLIALTSGTIDTARADPYPWCAILGGSTDLSTGCYYMTLQQCQASISGNGGFCTHNNFYDGRPVTTPEDAVRSSRKRTSRK